MMRPKFRKVKYIVYGHRAKKRTCLYSDRLSLEAKLDIKQILTYRFVIALTGEMTGLMRIPGCAWALKGYFQDE
jgi:hypothetical protein